jgi:hypothetical protein
LTKLEELQQQRREQRQLVDVHAPYALKLSSLANPSRQRVERLIELLLDHEMKAAWKGRGETRREGKNEAIPPGNPTVAGFILKIDADLERLENRRLKSVQRFRIEIDALIENAERRLRDFESPDEVQKKRTTEIQEKKNLSSC